MVKKFTGASHEKSEGLDFFSTFVFEFFFSKEYVERGEDRFFELGMNLPALLVFTDPTICGKKDRLTRH